MTVLAQSASSGRAPNLWAATALMGLVTLGLIVWLAGLLPAQSCGAAAGSPLAAFQTARSAQDIWAVFGAEPSACRDALIASMDAVNRGDLFGYVPSAALLMLGFFVASRRPGRGLAFGLGLLAVAAGALGDAVETAAQLSITAQIAGASPAAPSELSLTLLSVGNTAKVASGPFVLLAAGLLWIGRGIGGTALAVALLACALVRLIPLFGPALGLLGMLSWLGSIALVSIAAIWFAIVQRLAKASR